MSFSEQTHLEFIHEVMLLSCFTSSNAERFCHAFVLQENTENSLNLSNYSCNELAHASHPFCIFKPAHHVLF